MDCGSEEQLIRMKLSDISHIQALQFDLTGRKLTVFHTGQVDEIQSRLENLNLGAKLEEEKEAVLAELPEVNSGQRKSLIAVLLINLGFFFIESIAGYFASSVGLFADSLDMLADALVYGLALFVVGRAASSQKRIAGLIAAVQLILICYGYYEVINRFLNPAEMPHFITMIVVSVAALIANIITLRILKGAPGEGNHMKASEICTSNDVIVNAGVIVAGTLVYFTKSNLPDLIVGSVVFLVVLFGVYRIVQLARN